MPIDVANGLFDQFAVLLIIEATVVIVLAPYQRILFILESVLRSPN